MGEARPTRPHGLSVRRCGAAMSGTTFGGAGTSILDRSGEASCQSGFLAEGRVAYRTSCGAVTDVGALDLSRIDTYVNRALEVNWFPPPGKVETTQALLPLRLTNKYDLLAVLAFQLYEALASTAHTAP